VSVAVIFDLDGTLIDSAPDIHAAVNRALATFDLPGLTLAEVKGFVGSGAPVLLSRCLAALGQQATGDLLQSLYRTFLGIYEEAFELTTLYPSVLETLTELSAAGHSLGICTNKPVGPTVAVLRHFGLGGLFRSVIGGDSLPVRKPDPAPLWHVVKDLDSDSAVFVGDSEVDAETAVAASLPFFLFTEGYRKSAVESLNPTAVFSDHSALPALIKGFRR
jgi:phosphoglycolate phosphatase